LIDGLVYGNESQYRAMFTASCYDSSWIPAYPITTRFEDVIDGTSNTVAISETVQGVARDGGAVDDCRGMIWWGLYCFFNTNQSPNTMDADICYGVTAYPQHPVMPTNTTVGDSDGNYMKMSARSWHAGGVNAGLTDGSIRFVQDQINLDIWQGTGSTNGSEIGSLH
jgi:hypothetical protein